MVSCCRNCNVTHLFNCLLLYSQKLNSQAYITKTYHEGKPLPIGTFVLKRHFAHVHFSDKLKPLRIGPYKILDRLSVVTYELLAQDGSTLHVHRNHLIPYYPEEPLLYPHLRNFMRFSDSIKLDIPKPIKYANSDSSPFNSDESLSDDTSFSDNDQTLSPNNFSPQTSSNTNPPSKIDPPFLFNQFFNLLVPISPVTELVTHLRTNLHHLLLQIIEIPKLIII